MNLPFSMKLLAFMLLSGAPLLAMQITDDEVSDEETINVQEDELPGQQGWGVRAFLEDQVAGVGELLTFGSAAVVDLVAAATNDGEEKRCERKDSQVGLITSFLSNSAEYALQAKSLPQDMRRFIGRYLLRNHPLIQVLSVMLRRPLCLHAWQPGQLGYVWSAKFNSAGNKVAAVGADNSVKIWDAHTGELLHTLMGHTAFINSVQFDELGDRIVSASIDKTAVMWDTLTGKRLHTFCGHTDIVSSVQFNAQLFVTASSDGTAMIWNAATGQCIRLLKGHGKAIHSARFNALGTKIITASGDKTIKMWDVTTRECEHTFYGHHDTVWSAHYNRAEDRIVTASFDGTARIWDVTSRECVHTLVGHTNAVMSAEFNAAGDKIVTTSRDNTAKIWDVATGECIHTLLGHSNSVFVAEFNAAGDYILTASDDCTVRVWDVVSGSCICVLAEPGRKVLSARFNATGMRIVASFEDGTAKIWDMGSVLFNLNYWLERECSFEQVLLLHCIYETRITHALFKKRNPNASLRFDFNVCPHLQEYFDTMPVEIQTCLKPFVMRKK